MTTPSLRLAVALVVLLPACEAGPPPPASGSGALRSYVERLVLHDLVKPGPAP